MKKLFLILLLAPVIGHSQFVKEMFSGRAGDVWHLTGSCIGVLAIQKTFETEWQTAAVSMIFLGIAWEAVDEIYGKGIFDPAGFSGSDLFFDVFGVMLSYPLKYDFGEVKFSHNRIGIRLYL